MQTLRLVEETLALGCTAKTRNAVFRADLAVELVVVCQLLVWLGGGVQMLVIATRKKGVKRLGNLLCAIALSA